MFINLLTADPGLYMIVLLGVITSVVLHELGHAFAAEWQGDPTPRMLGHMTWDPRVHMGWLSLGFAAVLGFAFGRTPVQPRNFRNRRWGDAMVSFAGPAVNVALALLSAMVAGGALASGVDDGSLVAQFWVWMCLLNVLLFVFNMIPLPPFDGYSVARAFVSFGSLDATLRRSGMMNVIIAIVLFNMLGGYDLCHTVAMHAIGFFLGIFGG